MSVSTLVFTIIDSLVAMLCAFVAALQWAHRYGHTAGKREAGLDAERSEDRARIDILERKIDTLERLLTEPTTKIAEVIATQEKRRR